MLPPLVLLTPVAEEGGAPGAEALPAAGEGCSPELVAAVEAELSARYALSLPGSSGGSSGGVTAGVSCGQAGEPAAAGGRRRRLLSLLLLQQEREARGRRLAAAAGSGISSTAATGCLSSGSSPGADGAGAMSLQVAFKVPAACPTAVSAAKAGVFLVRPGRVPDTGSRRVAAKQVL